MIRTQFLLFISLMTFSTYLYANEEHAQFIIEDILSLKQEALKDSKSEENIFLTFWDFDGTILKGDCSEGLYENNTEIYKGFAQLAIEEGYSEIYKGEKGYQQFIKDYRYFEEKIGRWFAYPFIAQMLYGANTKELGHLAQKYFEKVLQNYYYESSIKIISALKRNNIHTYIVSASADIFVDEASSTLKLQKKYFHGIKMETIDAKQSYKIAYPITWGDGKTEKIKEIIAHLQKEHVNKNIIVLAAFGNSYSTDGPFMKYIKDLSLEKAITVMINGGKAPLKYQGAFQSVTQKKLIKR